MGFLNKGYKILGMMNTINNVAKGKGLAHKARKTARKHLSPEKLFKSRLGKQKHSFF